MRLAEAAGLWAGADREQGVLVSGDSGWGRPYSVSAKRMPPVSACIQDRHA